MLPPPRGRSSAESSLVAFLERGGDDARAQSLVRAIVDEQLEAGAKPEHAVMALKSLLESVRWPTHLDHRAQRARGEQLVLWCIEAYFRPRHESSSHPPQELR